MPKGGRRPGAGRKAGAAWKSARPQSARDLAKDRVKEVLTTNQDPLAILVSMANDVDNDPQLRVAAATAACPYIFPRLSASVVALSGPPAKHDHAALVDKIMGRLAGMTPPATIEHVAPQVEVA